MKKFCLLIGVALLCTGAQAKKKKYVETYCPEESGLSLSKITDESTNSVLANLSHQQLGKSTVYLVRGALGTLTAIGSKDYLNSMQGYCKTKKYYWYAHRLLSMSPDGKRLAYATRQNGQDNVMLHNTQSGGVSTQRTFRNVGNFSWGPDDRIYFSDQNDGNSYICSVSAKEGNLMSSLTNGNVYDADPILSNDGQTLYFTRLQKTGPSVWSLNIKTNELTSCCRGFYPCPDPKDNNSFYCVRNSTAGRSEIWNINIKTGAESLVLSDTNRSFTHPSISPDGQWIAVVGNSVSSISKKNNLDVFVVRADGTRLTQITYHPDDDTCPVWSTDSKYIYFLSSRANEDNAFNVWRMAFNM